MFLMFLMYIYNPQTFVYTPQFQIPRNNTAQWDDTTLELPPPPLPPHIHVGFILLQ